MTKKYAKVIPLSIPVLMGNEWNYVKECLDEQWVSSVGPFVHQFEKKTAQFTGSKYVIACVNGTSALHISMIISGVKPDDEVIVPTLTFIAPVNVIRYLNANPVFMDCDIYYNIDVEKTIEFIEKETVFRNGQTHNRRTQKRISAIIPVHIFGNAVDLQPLISVCNERNIRIIEDASESLGTRYLPDYLEGKHTGTIGEMGCLSFNGNKIITTGGGGMILTNNAKYAEKAVYLTTQAKDDKIRYIHNEIGYNYRLSNIQAALGVAQLEKLPEYLTIKKKNYEKYKTLIKEILGLELGDVPPFAVNNLWMYALQLNSELYPFDIKKLMENLENKGVQTRPVWQLNHLQKPYKNCYSYKIEKANELIFKTLNIPCSTNLSENEIEYITQTLEGIKDE